MKHTASNVQASGNVQAVGLPPFVTTGGNYWNTTGTSTVVPNIQWQGTTSGATYTSASTITGGSYKG